MICGGLLKHPDSEAHTAQHTAQSAIRRRPEARRERPERPSTRG